MPRPEQGQDCRRDVAQAHRLGDRPACREPLRIDDHEGDLDQLPIQAAPVEEEPVVAQVLPVVGGHDHHRVVEHPALPQLVEQQAQPTVKMRDRVIIEVVGHLYVADGELQLVEDVPLLQDDPLGPGRGPDTEVRGRIVRDLIKRVGVVIVQEGEEGASPRALPREPVQKPRSTSAAPLACSFESGSRGRAPPWRLPARISATMA